MEASSALDSSRFWIGAAKILLGEELASEPGRLTQVSASIT